MTSIICLLISLTSIAFLSAGYYLSSTFYYKKFDVKYSIKRMFPYEVNYPNSFRNNIYGNIAFVIGLVGVVAFYLYSISFSSGKTDVPLIVLSVASLLMAGFIAALLFLPLQFLRMHMILSTCAMVFAFAIPALECCYIYPLIKNMIEYKAVYIAAAIVGLVMSLFMLILIFNPKATYRIYLDRSVDKDGNETFSRPKFIPMAFNEWWAIITFFISPIPFVIISFLL